MGDGGRGGGEIKNGGKKRRRMEDKKRLEMRGRGRRGLMRMGTQLIVSNN